MKAIVSPEAKATFTGAGNAGKKLDCLADLLDNKVKDWTKERLESCVKALAEMINQDKDLYFVKRKALIACQLALNRMPGPAPILRPAVKVPRIAPADGYPDWANAASNDKQFIDLDYLLVNFPQFIQSERSRYCFFNECGFYQVDSVQDFIWDVGYVRHKLDSLNLPSFLMFYTQSLRTKELWEYLHEITKACLGYEQFLIQKQLSDKRAQLTDDGICLRVNVLRSLFISKHTKALKNSDVKFFLEGMTGCSINAGRLSKLLKQVKADCIHLGLMLHDEQKSS